MAAARNRYAIVRRGLRFVRVPRHHARPLAGVVRVLDPTGKSHALAALCRVPRASTDVTSSAWACKFGAMRFRVGLLPWLLLIGCPGDESGAGVEAGPSSSADESSEASASPTTNNMTQTSAPTSTASSEPSSSGVESSSSSSSSSDSDTTGAVETGVRFVGFGDAGEGNEAQQRVANAAEVVCQDRGCDFAMMLGDNFYDEGVTSV